MHKTDRTDFTCDVPSARSASVSDSRLLLPKSVTGAMAALRTDVPPGVLPLSCAQSLVFVFSSVEQIILGRYERSGHIQRSSRAYLDGPIVAGLSPTALNLRWRHLSLLLCNVCASPTLILLRGIAFVGISLL